MGFNVAFLVVPDSIIHEGKARRSLSDDEFRVRFQPWVDRLIEQLSDKLIGTSCGGTI